MSDEIERLRKEVADLREWHRRDSAELRRLCEARDEARNALAVRMRERATADEHLAQVIAAARRRAWRCATAPTSAGPRTPARVGGRSFQCFYVSGFRRAT